MKRLLLLSSACLTLTACIDDGTLAERIEKTESARVVYSASALKNFAMMNATGQGPLGEVREGPNGLRSMTCAMYDGRREGYSFSWVDSAIDEPAYAGRNSKSATRNGSEGLPQGSVAANIAKELGPQFVAAWSGGKLVRSGELLPFASECPLPELPDGSPVVMVPVKIPDGSFTASTREEKRSDACPEGEIGASIYTRQVQFTKDGRRIEGQWHLDSLAGCRPANTVEAVVTEIEHVAPAVGADTQGTETNALIQQAASAVSGTCKEVTLKHKEGTKQRSARTFTTCDFAEVAAVVTPDEPVGVPKQPKEPPALPPPCPDAGPFLLGPAFSGWGGPSSKQAIADALAPWLVRAAETRAGCPPIRVYGTVWWPYYQTFRADWNGRKEWGIFTRRYNVALNLSFEIATGTASTIERHSAPSNNWTYNTYTTWPDFRAFPDAFKSGSEQWMYVQFNTDFTSFSVSSMSGRSYPNSIGPRVGPSVIWPLSGAPYPYPNDGPSPWTNNAQQAPYQSSISYAAFSREVFRYHGGGSVADYPPLRE